MYLFLFQNLHLYYNIIKYLLIYPKQFYELIKFTILYKVKPTEITNLTNILQLLKLLINYTRIYNPNTCILVFQYIRIN